MAECNLLKIYRRCKTKWLRRSSNTCCSKRILLLLVWSAVFRFALSILALCMRVILPYATPNNVLSIIVSLSQVSLLLAPVIGWLADVKIGRYEVIKFAAVLCLTINIIMFVLNVLIVEGVEISIPALVMSAAPGIFYITNACVSAAMLPFLTDQLIGGTADQLRTVVYWYCWAVNFGLALSEPINVFDYPDNATISNGVYCIVAVPLALIIISDCLCLQWLDRTHKVTNPIKLIIQVLNYTRKHRYPERRSAFTYLDEEQPSRMDFGKEKFGGPFTEEEVEMLRRSCD